MQKMVRGPTPYGASQCAARDISVPLSEIYCTYHVTATQPVRPPPGFCHCWSVRLERSSGPCLQSELHRSCFHVLAKVIFIRTVLAHPARWGGGVGLLMMRYI